MLSKILLLKIALDLPLVDFFNFCLMDKNHFELYRDKRLLKYKLLHILPDYKCNTVDSISIQIIKRMFLWLNKNNKGTEEIYVYSTDGDSDSILLFNAQKIGVLARDQTVAHSLFTLLSMVIDHLDKLDIYIHLTLVGCNPDIDSNLPLASDTDFDLFMRDFPCEPENEYSLNVSNQSTTDMTLFDINDIYCGMLKLYEHHEVD